MPNVKYLAFGTSNIKKLFSWGILNLINFDTREQYCSVFGTVQTDVLKNKNLLFYSFPLSAFITFLSSLFYFFLLSSSFCSYLLSLPLPFFFFFLLQHLHSGFRFFFFFFFLSLSLFLSFPVMKKKAIPIWSRARRLKLANLNLYSLIWSSARLGAVADLCSSSSTALIADGWLSLVIDWSVGLRFCWRFWVFFFFWLRFLDLEFIEGFGDCGCSLWRWLLVLGWWWLPLAVHLYICWVLGKYIILLFRIKE